MRIQFYEDPVWELRSRKEVRFKRLGLFMYDDGRRFAIGFELTPFQERPSIQVFVSDDSGNEQTSMTIIEAMQPNFSLTMHLPEKVERQKLKVNAVLYYELPDQGRVVVDKMSTTLDATKPGEQ
jgi:hypothetical protein